MIAGKATIHNEVGLHARPAAAFVRAAEKYNANVRLAKDGMWVNGKSILAILTMAAEHGSELLIEVDGPDEEVAFPVLKARLESDEA